MNPEIGSDLLFGKRIMNWYNRLSAGKILLAIFLVGLLIRIIEPNLKLLHHDEAIHAWFAYDLFTKGTYLYDPMYHGPLLYYIVAAAYSLFGDTDLIVRLIPGITGSLLVPLVYLLFRQGYLRKNEAVIAGLFISLSPDMVYFSRFLRHDIFQLVVTFALLICILAYIEKKRWYYAILAGILTACGLCLKEDMPFTLLIFGSFFLFMILFGKVKLPETWIRDTVIAILVCAGIGFTFYSSLFTHPEMFLQAPIKAVEHWTSMHEQCRLCGPPYWYILIIGLYELPLFALACYNVFQWGIRDHGCKRVITSVGKYLTGVGEKNQYISPYTGIIDKSPFFMLFALYWTVLSMAFYGYVGEKVPWLLIHQLLPLILVAVYDVRSWKIIFSVIICIWMIIMTMHLCFTPADINEPIVQVQNSEDLRSVMNLIDASDRVVVASDTYWPLPWYYRGSKWDKISFYGKKVEPSAFESLDADMVITHDTDSYPSLPGYEKLQYKQSYWFSWYDNKDRALEYYFLRDGKMGSINFDVFVKPELLQKTNTTFSA